MEQISHKNNESLSVSVVLENAFEPVGAEILSAMPGTLVLQLPAERLDIDGTADTLTLVQPELPQSDSNEKAEYRARIAEGVASDRRSIEALVQMKVRNELVQQLFKELATQDASLDFDAVCRSVRSVYAAERQRHIEQFYYVIDTILPLAKSRHQMSSLPGYYRDKDVPFLQSRVDVDTAAVEWLDEMLDETETSTLEKRASEYIDVTLFDAYKEVLSLKDQQLSYARQLHDDDQATIKAQDRALLRMSEQLAEFEMIIATENLNKDDLATARRNLARRGLRAVA